PDVGHPDRSSVFGGDDDVVELVGRIDASEGSQQQLRLALFDRAAWYLDVLTDDGVANLLDGEAIRVQFLDVHDDVNLARAAATEVHLADAVDRLNCALHLLVGNLGQCSQAHRIG